MAHLSVLKEEVIQAAPDHTQHILDCTLGGGGHSHALLQRFPQAELVAIDRDPMAMERAKTVLSQFLSQIRFLEGTFAERAAALQNEEIQFDYVLADIGVSSFQLDEPERGFSFRNDGPLDMRMTPDDAIPTAADWVNEKSEQELFKIFATYGEERFSRKIARKIVQSRQVTPFETTQQLADLIKETVPRKFHKPGYHPATQIFQALRIVVNQELEELKTLLDVSKDLLNSHGRIAIIAFHSLEDRLVKQSFKRWEHPCTCPPEWPRCMCGLQSWGKVITKRPLTPTEGEIQTNPRSRSAKLRIFEHCES